MMVTQQYLTTELHKIKEDERPNQRGPVLQFGRMSRVEQECVNENVETVV